MSAVVKCDIVAFDGSRITYVIEKGALWTLAAQSNSRSRAFNMGHMSSFYEPKRPVKMLLSK